MERKKEIFGRSIKAGVLVLLFISSVAMAGTFNIVMDVAGGTVSASVTVEESPWDNTALGLSATNESATNQVNINNTGEEHIEIKCNCSSTAGWTIQAAAGANQFRLQCKENAAGSYVNMGTTGVIVFADLAPVQNRDFRLKLYMPTSTTHYDEQTAVVTFSYTEYVP